MGAEGTKKCKQCKWVKPLSAFWNRYNVRDGKRSYCIECEKAKHSAWCESGGQELKRAITKRHYCRRREDIRARASARFRESRQKVIDGLGGKCACCGEHRITMLDIDHVQNDGHEHKKHKPGWAIYADMIAQGLPRDRFQVLCSNCNQSKRRNGGACEHKTEAGWATNTAV